MLLSRRLPAAGRLLAARRPLSLEESPLVVERSPTGAGPVEAEPGRVETGFGEADPGDARSLVEDQAHRRDLRLLEVARAGNLDAFNELVVLHQDHLFALVARMVPDRDQAADAVQDAFFNAYRNLASFRGGSVRGWLSRIAVNAALDIQRARRRRPVQPYPELEDDSWQPPAGEEADPERTLIDREQSRMLAGALEAITPEQRAAIVLYDVEGFDYGEIATMTGVSLGTVKSRIHRGRLALRGLLVERGRGAESGTAGEGGPRAPGPGTSGPGTPGPGTAGSGTDT